MVEAGPAGEGAEGGVDAAGLDWAGTTGDLRPLAGPVGALGDGAFRGTARPVGWDGGAAAGPRGALRDEEAGGGRTAAGMLALADVTDAGAARRCEKLKPANKWPKVQPL